MVAVYFVACTLSPLKLSSTGSVWMYIVEMTLFLNFLINVEMPLFILY
jgi:hypothetical protein